MGANDAAVGTASGTWLERALLLAIVLACAVAVSPNTADPDLWGHVQYGRDAVEFGHSPTTTYSFTADGYPWINHENLAELLLYLGADTIGPAGLLIVKCLLGLGVIFLILRHALAQGVRMITVCAVVLLVAVNLSFHWSVRPQLLSYTFYALMLALFAWCFAGWEGCWRLSVPRLSVMPSSAPLDYQPHRLRLLWLAPVMFVFWANSHGGFVAGYCIFSAYLVLRSIELISCRGRAAAPVACHLLLLVVATGLATLVNPYGFGLHAWLLESLGRPRPEITEWHPPDLWNQLSIPLWLITAMFLLTLTATRRSRDFTHLAILALTFWQSLEHQRHIPFFAIAFGFWIPLHLESVLQRLGLSRQEAPLGGTMSVSMRWILTTGVCLTYLLLAGKLYFRLSDMPVNKREFPVAALQYVADQQLEGNLVVTYNWAQYAIAAFGPRTPDDSGIRVGFDGRFRTCYPQSIVDMHFDLILGNLGPMLRYRSPQAPRVDGGRVLEFGQPKYGPPDLVLINRFQPHSEHVMNQHREKWTLLYQDEIAQLWGRSSKYDDRDSPRFIPPDERLISDDRQEGSVTWPALPVRRSPTQLARS